MNLADLLQREGWAPASGGGDTLSRSAPSEEIRELARHVREQITSSIPRFHCDNVAEYFCQHWPERREFDFPNLAPPFPEFFVEYVVPERYRKDVYRQLKRVGVSFSYSEEEGGGWLVRCVIFFSDHREEGVLGPLSVTEFRVDPRGKHVETVQEVFARDEAFHLLSPDDSRKMAELTEQWRREKRDTPALFDRGIAAKSHFLAEKGAHIDDRTDDLLEGLRGARERYHAALMDTLAGGRLPDIPLLLGPALLTVSFLHCKNVSSREEVPNPRKVKVDIKRGRKPPLRFHVLEIFPADRAVKRGAVTYGSDAERHQALHICRGHFKTFTPEKPLLGRHVGTYWWADQVRGRAEEGAVAKEYRVNSPASEGNS